MTVLDREDGSSSKKKNEDLRDEIRRLETPRIADIESALKDVLAQAALGRGLSNRECLSKYRFFCELARAELWVHAFECKCNVPEKLRLTAANLDGMGSDLEGIVVPPMQYHDERDRAAGLVRSYFEVPEVGQQYQSSSQPERQPYLAERTQEDYAHRILNDDMMRKVAGFVVMLQVHGILKYREERRTFKLPPPHSPAPAAAARPELPASLIQKLQDKSRAARPAQAQTAEHTEDKPGGETG